MKKILIIVGVIILTLIARGYYLNLSLYTGFSDPALRIQALQTPDKITELACSNGVKLAVITHTRVDTGNKFELGTESTLVEVSDLKIEFDGKNITRTSEDLAQFPLQFTTGFPQGFTIDTVFALSSAAKSRIDSGSNIGKRYTGIVLKSDEISAESAKNIATCLKEHTEKINTFVPETLGWVARMKESFTTYGSFSPRQIFTCPSNDGVVAVQGDEIDYSLTGTPNSWFGVGTLFPSGNIKFFEDNPKSQMAIESFKSMNKSTCKDVNGRTLLDALMPVPVTLI